MPTKVLLYQEKCEVKKKRTLMLKKHGYFDTMY